MKELLINVYDDENNIIKTSKAEPIKIKFGAIRSLMKLLKIDDINDTSELMRTIYDAWEELTVVLTKIFPDMDEKDWYNVELAELIPVVIEVLKFSFSNILTIPNDSKN